MAVKLNNFVHRSSGSNKFITFFFCELDQNTCILRYINAGHNPVFVMDPKGKVKRLESSGFCLGMFPNAEYSIDEVQLKLGEMAVLYTDGITESRNTKNDEFGEERLIGIMKKNLKLNAQDLMDKVKDETESFTRGTEQMDDQTVVVIKRVC